MADRYRRRIAVPKPAPESRRGGVEALAIRCTKVPVVAGRTVQLRGETLPDLGAAHPIPATEGNLAQPGVDHGLEPQALADDRGGVDGPAQRTGLENEALEASELCRKQISQRSSLTTASFGQG